MIQILVILGICLVVATVVFVVALVQEERAIEDSGQARSTIVVPPSKGYFMWGSAVVPAFGIALLILSALSFDYIKAIVIGGNESTAERLILERSIAEVRANLAVMERSCAIPNSKHPSQTTRDKPDFSVCSTEVKEKAREIERIIQSLRATVY